MKKQTFVAVRNGEHIGYYSTREEAEKKISESKAFDEKMTSQGWDITTSKYCVQIH